MADSPSLISFGSLTTWPSATELEQLRYTLSQHEHLIPVQEAFLTLPKLWETLVTNDERLKTVPGLANSEQLAAWVSDKQAIDRGQNILCLPLTILRHLCDYSTYIKQNGKHSTILDHAIRGGGIQGFCAGLLSALAVAGSKDEEELGRHGALSIRLAFAIGAYVDMDSHENEATHCLALRWKTADGIGTIQTLLRKHSLDSNPAYVSVLRDTADATITVPSSAFTAISAAFAHEGVGVLDTGLAGRYHCRNYQGVPERILQSCKQHGNIRFGAQNSVRSNTDGEILLHQDAVVMTGLRDILLEQSNWHLAISKARARVNGTICILAFGSDAIPQSISRDANVRILKVRKHDERESDEYSAKGEEPQRERNMAKYPADAIAIIGLSCKLPGANSPEEFWQLLTNGTAMAQPVPTNRWPEAAVPRGKTRKFWGNFMDGIDEFDHRFFKKAPREAVSMDPQQRLLLHGAYEAMEYAGYFATAVDRRDTNIGCYLGLCAIDYDANVASHPPNAFSTMGTLRAFLSGKISHFFGWDGPSLTIDTACSSSAVAVHTACRAIQNGEISQALAGGISLFTTPYLYENLAAAHFLSPTGATKPFDADADGYCRGEGLGLVVLKKLSTAVADGDNVLAVIAGSAVNQNDSCVPITVPHVRSQSKLYRHVSEVAGVLPHQVSFIEAHGTGTPVGDPIEMDSIRNVFGGSLRQHPLFVSSVKGNIGHLEGASGVAGLIKAVLQIEARTATRQASFKSLNPKIPPLHADKMMIPTSNTVLQDDFIVGCVNNYGAAGSNSTLMVMEPPRQLGTTSAATATSRYPILIAANCTASLVAYCQVLNQVLNRYCQQQITQAQRNNLLGSIAFNLSRRQNQSFPHVLATTASSLSNLEAQLQRQLVESTATIELRPSCPPLVLAFGGQVRDYVGLSKSFWNQSVLLRFHLDRCDNILRSMGYAGLYPTIFQREPILDVATLHSAIFSLQYASAQAWLDSGLVVDAVIGHSLGQLTALSVSGVLSLEDGLKLVAGRASLMKEYWGPEAGSMIAVEADLAALSELPHFSALEIACYNGPSSHVLVGGSTSVDAFQKALSEERLQFKRLDVRNGFHSRFTEPLLDSLEQLAASLHCHEPTIPIETCSDGTTWLKPTAKLIAQHTREPVFFGPAVQRLAHTLGACTWLEAGSDSSITNMARRALGSESFQHTFQSISLSKPTASDTLVDATTLLWKKGHSLQFWDFHPLQRRQYETLRLPSYQFEKNKHWLELIPPAPAPAVVASDAVTKTTPEVPQLVRLVAKDPQTAIFKIDPQCEEYQRLVAGHVVAGSPLCPATVYMEAAARAWKSLFPAKAASLLGISDLRIDSPLGVALDQTLTMTLSLRSGRDQCWDFSVASQQRGATPASQTSHAVGVVEIPTESATIDLDFARFERLTGPDAIEALYQDPESECIRGPLLYKMFSRVVDYGEPYRGLKSVAARNRCAAGTVVFQPDPEEKTVASLTRPATLDSFMQVAGIHANSIYSCPGNEVYVFTKLDRLQFGPDFMTTPPSSWVIFSNLTPAGSKELANDIFVFDERTKRLVVLILGARFHNVRLMSLTKVLSRVNVGANQGGTPTPAPSLQEKASIQLPPPLLPEPIKSPIGGPKGTSNNTVNVSTAQDVYASIFNDVCLLFERVADVPPANVKGQMSVEDLGIDSLMMLEVISELSAQFSIDIPIDDMVELSDVDSLVGYLRKRGCGQHERSLLSSSSGASSVLSSTSSFSLTPASTEPPTSSPFQPSTPGDCSSDASQQQQVDQLAKLLQEHLELETAPSLDANLGELGLDSLLAIELASDIEKLQSVSVDLYQLDDKSTFGDLVCLAGLNGSSVADTVEPKPHGTNPMSLSDHPPDPFPQISQAVSPTASLNAYEAFDAVRLTFDNISQEEGFAKFWNAVYPDQERLVLSYITEAFKQLGCDLASLPANAPLPKLIVLEKHKHLLERLHKILADGGYVDGYEMTGYRRSSKPLELAASQVQLKDTIAKFPLHASEHRLLDVTGSRLADCLNGKANPLSLLFANKANRKVLADVYDLAPMCRAATRLLANFLMRAFSPSDKNETFHILEVGGGTGGTSKFLVEFLTRSGVNFTYTFTDISSALVSDVKKKFAGYDCMRYATLNCDDPPRPDFIGKFHALISTNCIHATHNATTSLANIRQMLRPDDGFLALVEFTNGMYWFDLVYGLLDGWWLFGDGRRHALGDIKFWERSLLAAGYKNVNWTSGDTPEAKTLQLICGFNSTVGSGGQKHEHQSSRLSKRGGLSVETIVWKQVDDLELSADVYYPSEEEKSTAPKRPIALLFHGGGHVLFTRKDIHIKHIKNLVERGFLPVSVDYRLCPEVNLAEGPVTDAVDALVWARQALSRLHVERGDIRMDGDRVVAVGWSSGGHLAMTLPSSSKAKNIPPPEAILAFYCPSNLEDRWWKHPIYPKSVQESPDTKYDLLEGVGEKPISGYTPSTPLGSPMSLRDPRWRIIIHYNWKAQLVPILVSGLESKSKASASHLDVESLPMPKVEDIQAVSPYAQIVQGNYNTPTFMVHGDRDDLIPWQQTRDTIKALQQRGVEAGFAVPKDAGHAFDLWSNEDPKGTGWAAMVEGYDFICRYV